MDENAKPVKEPDGMGGNAKHGQHGNGDGQDQAATISHPMRTVGTRAGRGTDWADARAGVHQSVQPVQPVQPVSKCQRD